MIRRKRLEANGIKVFQGYDGEMFHEAFLVDVNQDGDLSVLDFCRNGLEEESMVRVFDLEGSEEQLKEHEFDLSDYDFINITSTDTWAEEEMFWNDLESK